jgi:Putative Actinobacterial Holin-X, holin superfamily III
MADDGLRDMALVRAFTDLTGDLSDFIQKELRLARAEIAQKLSFQLQAGVWFGASGVLGFVVVLLIMQGVVFALANAGLALHWACFLVAALLAIAAGLAFYYGRAGSAEDLMPTRTARQFNEAIRTAKEHLQ